MIELLGRPHTMDEAVAWFQRVAATDEGVKPYHTDVGDLLAEQPYTDAIAELVVRVFDEGPTVARAAMCSYLRARPVEVEPLRGAWLRWVSPPAPWLDDRSGGGTRIGALLAGAADACRMATDPAVSDAFLALADKFGTWALWTEAIAHKDPLVRGVTALRDGVDHGVVFNPGAAGMLAWRYAKDAPHLLAAVAGILSGHDEPVRAAFLNEARKHLDDERLATVAAAIGL